MRVIVMKKRFGVAERVCASCCGVRQRVRKPNGLRGMYEVGKEMRVRIQ